VALSTAAADIGIVSLVVMVVFQAQPLTPAQALNAGLLAFAGGLLQTALSIALWPLRRYDPERRLLSDLYLELSRAVDSPIHPSAAPPASAQSTQAQLALSAPGQQSLQAERYRSLLSQAERIRLSLLALSGLHRRLREDASGRCVSESLEQCFAISSHLLSSIGNLLIGGAAPVGPILTELQALAEKLRQPQPDWSPAVAAIARDARFQIDALAGQFRSALELAAHSTPEGVAEFEREQAKHPWSLQLSGTMAKLRANLSLQSAACRHAVRLAACVAVGEALSWSLGWRRTYWIPMTVAIILKPDFTATFSRGVLRLAGTLVGILLTTALFLLLHPATGIEIALIGPLMFILRCYGPANYGIAVTAVTAMVVTLISLAGMIQRAFPADVIAARAVNTTVGGAIALLAYAVWPTWERTQISEMIAQVLDGYRDYFHAVREGYLHPDTFIIDELDRTRVAVRLARSNLEASIDRLNSEPGASSETLSLLGAMLASSHRLVHAMMALEAGLVQTNPTKAREEFRTLANHIELTLHSLGHALRGSPLGRSELPDLREDHHALLAARGVSRTERHALVNVETDRITNSLNTLSEEILQWIDGSG
jgi:uncharacterized membrane protein YccC